MMAGFFGTTPVTEPTLLVFQRGNDDCDHDWSWSDAVCDSAPPQQGRRCEKCGRHELVTLDWSE